MISDQKLTPTRIKEMVSKTIDAEKAAFSPEADQQVRPLFRWQGVGRFLDNVPEPQEYIFDKVLPAKIVGAIFAQGGVGKTMLMLQMAMSLSTGSPFGQFKPVKPLRVLFIGGEDDEKVFHRRIYAGAPAMAAAGGGNIAAVREPLLRENMEVVSLVGQNRVITALDANGNPVTTPVFQQMKAAIRAIGNLDVLIIDPKSRFDGLNENDNSHATFFVNALEELVKEFSLTVLFSHHISKDAIKQGEVKSMAGRGASALYDGVRWAMALGELGQKEAEEYGVSATKHVEGRMTKGNYAEKIEHTMYFKRGNEGILEPVNLYMERLDGMTNALVNALANSGEQFTSRDLCKKPNDKNRAAAVSGVLEFIRELDVEITKNDMPKVIENAIRRGLLTDETIKTGKTTKTILVVSDHARQLYGGTVDTSEPPANEESEPVSDDSGNGGDRWISKSGHRSESPANEESEQTEPEKPKKRSRK